MRLFVTTYNGRKLTLKGEGTDDIESLLGQIYEADDAAHPGLQRLVHQDGRVLEAGKTLADYGLRHEDELRLGLRPAAQEIELKVGGVRHPTVLETLLNAPPGSRLHAMFEGMAHGLPPCFPPPDGSGAPGPDGVVEGLPPRLQPVGPLPRGPDTDGRAYHLIDRDGISFGYILNYLRAGTVALPHCTERLQQLAIEARYFGITELAEMCEAPLPSFVAKCGVGVTLGDILKLSTAQLDRLFEQQQVNLVVADNLRRALEAERTRIRAEEEAERARIGAMAEAERAREELRVALSKVHVRLADTQLRALAEGGIRPKDLNSMDAAAAMRFGLSAEDARKIDVATFASRITIKAWGGRWRRWKVCERKPRRRGRLCGGSFSGRAGRGAPRYGGWRWTGQRSEQRHAGWRTERRQRLERSHQRRRRWEQPRCVHAAWRRGGRWRWRRRRQPWGGLFGIGWWGRRGHAQWRCRSRWWEHSP
eukprot:COSAG02_NODE_4987_length_4748_cov_3.582061_1_plen_478_part_00